MIGGWAALLLAETWPDWALKTVEWEPAGQALDKHCRRNSADETIRATLVFAADFGSKGLRIWHQQRSLTLDAKGNGKRSFLADQRRTTAGLLRNVCAPQIYRSSLLVGNNTCDNARQ